MEAAGDLCFLGIILFAFGEVCGSVFGKYVRKQNVYGAVWVERNFFGKCIKWGLWMVVIGMLIEMLNS